MCVKSFNWLEVQVAARNAGRAQDRWLKQKVLEQRSHPLGAHMLSLDMGQHGHRQRYQGHDRSGVAVLERWLDSND
jgi:hypothetical protein